MDNSVNVIIKVLFIYKEFNCQLSTDLTLNENIILLNGLINKYISKNYLESYKPLVIEENSKQILNIDLKVKDLNIKDGITLLFY